MLNYKTLEFEAERLHAQASARRLEIRNFKGYTSKYEYAIYGYFLTRLNVGNSHLHWLGL